jgi:hypothetical protein
MASISISALGSRTKITSPVRLTLLAGLLVLLGAATAPQSNGQKTDLDALPAKDDAYRLDIRPARRIEAYGAVTFHVPNMTVQEWCLLGPKPPILPSQHPMESHMEPAGRVVFDLSPEHRPVYRALVPGRGTARHSHEVEFFFRGVLYARKLVVRPKDDDEPRHPELKPAVREHYLRETKQLDYKAPAFARWLERNHLRRQAEEGDIHLARRVYLAIKREFKDGPGAPSASKMVETHMGDCGGLANVFISALRANGIPARALCGRWAASTQVLKTGAPYFQGHVKTDFFARGVGWIPVDPYCAVQFDKGAFDSFGNDHGDFITFNVDRKLIVPTEIAGRQEVQGLQGPAFFTRGEGSLKDWSRGEKRWEVRVERLDSLPAGAKKEPLDDPPVAKDDPPKFYNRPALPPAVSGGAFRVEYRPDRLDVWKFYTSRRTLEQARTIAEELRQMGYQAIVVHGGPPGPVYGRSYALHERSTFFRDPWWRKAWWNEHHHSYHWHPYEHRVIHHHDHPTPHPHPHGGGSGHPLR